MRRQVFKLEDLLFQLRGEDVNPADNQHIVAASADAIHAAHGPRGSRQQARQIAGTIADHRQRLFGQRGKQQFTMLAIFQRRTVVRVDDFREEVVFPDSRAVNGFQTLHRYARSHDFRQTVNIQGGDPQPALDFRAHRQRPRLSAKDADPQ